MFVTRRNPRKVTVSPRHPYRACFWNCGKSYLPLDALGMPLTLYGAPFLRIRLLRLQIYIRIATLLGVVGVPATTFCLATSAFCLAATSCGLAATSRRIVLVGIVWST